MNILYSFLCFKSDIEKNRVNYINYFVNCLVVIVLILMKNYVYTPSTGFLSFLMFQTVSRELVRLLDTHLFFLFFQFDLLFYVSQTIHQNLLFVNRHIVSFYIIHRHKKWGKKRNTNCLFYQQYTHCGFWEY